jgi:glycosyltransferase involved in cell wall biosynthesis
LKATRALYISKSKTSHDKRFVEAFSQFTLLDETYLDEIGLLIESKTLANRDLVVASPLSTGISSIPDDCDARIIGICMAYEINEESKEQPLFEEIYRNIQRCTTIICDCQQIKNEIRNRFGFKGQILEIAYGCNQKDFLGIELQNRRELRMVSTRNWTRVHSNKTSLQALSIAKSNGLEFEMNYFGVGEELTEDIKSKSHENFQGDISFHGAYAQEDLPKILANSEIYVSTSISDGTSVSLLEAMSAGRICIGRDFASNREWIEHGQNGFLFSTTEELSKLLITISELSYTEKLQISDAARRSVIGRGEWDVMRKVLLEFGKKWLEP